MKCDLFLRNKIKYLLFMGFEKKNKKIWEKIFPIATVYVNIRQTDVFPRFEGMIFFFSFVFKISIMKKKI